MAHSIVLPKLYFRSSTYLMLILPIYLFLNVYLRALSRALLTTSTYLCYDIYNYARTYFYYFKLFPARCTFLRRFGGSFTKRLNCLRGSCSDVATIVRIAKDILPNSQFISICFYRTNQCYQIGRFLQVLGSTFSYKRSCKYLVTFWYLENTTFN